MDKLDYFYTEFKDAYRQFAKEATSSNKLSKVSIDFLDHLVGFFSSRTNAISQGSTFYRATCNRQTPMTKQDFWPHDAFRSSGRLDKEDQFFLYMANSKAVCLYEMGSTIDQPALAVAAMKTTQQQNIACMEREMDIFDYFVSAP